MVQKAKVASVLPEKEKKKTYPSVCYNFILQCRRLLNWFGKAQQLSASQCSHWLFLAFGQIPSGSIDNSLLPASKLFHGSGLKKEGKQAWTPDSPTTASNMANIFFLSTRPLHLIQLSRRDLNPWNSRWHRSAAGLCIFNILSFEMRNFEESSALVHPRMSWNPESYSHLWDAQKMLFGMFEDAIVGRISASYQCQHGDNPHTSAHIHTHIKTVTHSST